MGLLPYKPGCECRVRLPVYRFDAWSTSTYSYNEWPPEHPQKQKAPQTITYDIYPDADVGLRTPRTLNSQYVAHLRQKCHWNTDSYTTTRRAAAEQLPSDGAQCYYERSSPTLCVPPSVDSREFQLIWKRYMYGVFLGQL